MKESSRLVHDLILEPKNYKTLFQRYASALILRLTYGAKIDTGEEEIVRLVYENQVNVERVAAPGKYLVDVLPILLWLPTWLAPFKQEAAIHRKREVSLFSGLVDDVRKDIEAGKAGESFTRLWLENKQKFGLSDLQGTYVLGGLYSAAASTTASLAMSWVLMMVHNPDWLVKLQDEIDRVVGQDRLPEFGDLPQLPTVRAVVKEVARMRPVTAGGKFLSLYIHTGAFSNISVPQVFHIRPHRTMSMTATSYQKEVSFILIYGELITYNNARNSTNTKT